jgi:putative colanic acid biosynthesis acetyltransferase WcaF
VCSSDLTIQKIILEDGVWLGAQSLVCAGVIVFSHAVLSVQSVATKNVEAYSIYAGNPAVFIRARLIEPDKANDTSSAKGDNLAEDVNDF